MSNKHINITFDVVLTALSPLAINSGKEASPLSDYFVKDGLLYCTDADKFQELLAKDDSLMGRYEEAVLKTEISGAGDFLNRLLSEEELKKLSSGSKGIPFHSVNRIALKKIMRSNGMPYVPGSSVKGAIKTAILYWWLTKEKASTLSSFLEKNNEKIKRYLSNRKRLRFLDNKRKKKSNKLSDSEFKELKKLQELKNKVLKSLNEFTKDIEQHAFGIKKQNEKHNSILRQPATNLKISDSNPVVLENIEVGDVTRYSRSEEKEWVLHLQEYIKEGVRFETQIQISALEQDWELFDKSHFFVKLLRDCQNNLNGLFEILRHFAESAGGYQKEFGIALPAGINDLNDNEAVLFLGSGKDIYRNTVLMAVRQWYIDNGLDFKNDFAPLISNRVRSEFKDFPNSISHINKKPLGWLKVSQKKTS